MMLHETRCTKTVTMNSDDVSLHASNSYICLQTTMVHGALCPSEHGHGRREDRPQSEMKQIFQLYFVKNIISRH